MNGFVKKNAFLSVFTMILFSADAILLIAETYALARIMQCAEEEKNSNFTVAIIVAFGIFILEKICVAAMLLMRQKLLTEGEMDYKRKIIKSIFERRMTLFRKKDDAYYVNLLTTDIDIYRNECLGNYPWFFFFGVYGIVSIGMLAYINIWLMAAAIVTSIVPFFLEKVLTPLIEKARNEFTDASEHHYEVLKETIEGNETIRKSLTGLFFCNRYIKASSELRTANAKLKFREDLSMQTLSGAAGFLQLIVLVVGVFLAINGKIGIAMLFAAMDYAISASNSFSSIADYYMEIKASKSTVNKLNKETVIEDVKDDEFKEESLHDPVVEFVNFSFSYGTKVLYDNFNFRIENKGCYCILGESGSGKTTLVNCIMKYYDEYMGKILINGIEVKNIPDKEVYKLISYVDQSRFMFNEKLYDNITMLSGTPKEDSADYQGVIKKVNLDTLAQHIGNRKLGDLGEGISGGERQRISIARMLCRNAEIFIFDEPTAGLDPENARIVNEMIFSMKEKTRIVITHDRNEDYLRRFDAIIRI